MKVCKLQLAELKNYCVQFGKLGFTTDSALPRGLPGQPLV